jgi:hypothetical protein
LPQPPATPPTRIYLLGAPDSGATELSAALQAQLAPPYLVQAQTYPTLPEGCTSLAALILLVGLDGPADAVTLAWHTQCRAALAAQGCAFQVLYGSGPQRLEAALRAVDSAHKGALRQPLPPHPAERTARLRNWACEKCSDPECEHRLFTALKGLSA